MNSQKLLWIIAIAAMVASTGCAGKYTGGGWIPGVDGESKANFGFQMQSDGGSVKGQVQYNDHGDGGVKFHGVVEAMVSGYGTGTATINPGGETGAFEIYVEDNGKPGEMDPADYIEVRLWTGYSNAGNLCGGNIQYHPPE